MGNGLACSLTGCKRLGKLAACRNTTRQRNIFSMDRLGSCSFRGFSGAAFVCGDRTQRKLSCRFVIDLPGSIATTRGFAAAALHDDLWNRATCDCTPCYHYATATGKSSRLETRKSLRARHCDASVTRRHAIAQLRAALHMKSPSSARQPPPPPAPLDAEAAAASSSLRSP